MTWNIVRDLLILEYETPAHDRYLDCPNFFITLKHSPVAAKIEALLTNYLSQKEKHSFGKETFVSLLQIGGVGVAPSTRYVEPST